MSYQASLTPTAARQLGKLDPSARRRLQAAIDLLAQQPRPPAAVQLIGGAGAWRVRVGDHRVRYDVNDDRLLVLALAVGHRREIYRER